VANLFLLRLNVFPEVRGNRRKLRTQILREWAERNSARGKDRFQDHHPHLPRLHRPQERRFPGLSGQLPLPGTDETVSKLKNT